MRPICRPWCVSIRRWAVDRTATATTHPARILATNDPDRHSTGHGEHTAQRIIERHRIARKRPAQQSAETIGRRLPEIVVQDRRDADPLDDLAEASEVGDWKMPDFKMACAYAVSQGWLIIRDDVLTLTVAGLAAA